MKKLLLWLLAATLLPLCAAAQPEPTGVGPEFAPNWYTGYRPTAYEWQVMWSNKLGYYTGGLPISLGGTGATTAAGARANLGIPDPTLVNYPLVANNAGLQALSTALYPRVVRGGYAAQGDGGYAEYVPTNVACSLNAGAGDGGSQVQSSNGKCWVIDYVATPMNPFVFGAKGDGSNDDTSAFNALTAASIRLGTTLNWGAPPTAWRWTSTVTINYQSTAQKGFQIMANGAFVDSSAITSTPSLVIQCGTTSGQDSADCQGLKIVGKLQIRGSTTDFMFMLGKSDLSDVNQGVVIDDLLIANSSTNPNAGGCLFSFPTTDNIRAICDVVGGGGKNSHGAAAGATIVGASMNNFQLSATAGSCVVTGTCTSVATSRYASGILVAEPVPQSGFTQPPVNTANVFSGADIEVAPSCFGVTALTFVANNLNSQFMSCFNSVNVALPTQVTLTGTATAGNSVTLTATNIAGTPAPSYTVVGGNTLGDIAAGLAAAVNANATLQNAGVYANADTTNGLVFLTQVSAVKVATTWTAVASGGATVTPTAATVTGVGGNTITNLVIEGQPSWTRGKATGFELVGQGFWQNWTAPYGSTYTVQGLDSNGLISSLRAGTAAQTVTAIAVNASSGASSVTVDDASNVVAGMLVAGLGVPAGTTAGSPTGNVVPLVGHTLNANVFVGTPIAFTPASNGTSGHTMTVTLPDCNLVNGDKSWVVSLMAENDNPMVVNTVGGQNINSDNHGVTSLAINITYDKATLRCSGSPGYWVLDSASERVLADNGYGTTQTWTPVLKFGGGSTTATVSGHWSQNGSKQVIAELQIALTNKNGHTGSATIDGLPVVALSNSGQVICAYNAGMAGLVSPIVGYTQSNTIFLTQQAATGVAAMDDTNWTTTSNQINCTATYLAQ